MLSTLAALALAATVTNTETVHDLESFGGQVVACTEGGLELFSPAGKSLRVLTLWLNHKVTHAFAIHAWAY